MFKLLHDFRATTYDSNPLRHAYTRAPYPLHHSKLACGLLKFIALIVTSLKNEKNNFFCRMNIHFQQYINKLVGFQSRVVSPRFSAFSSIYLFSGVFCSLVAVVLVFVFSFWKPSVFALHDSPPYFWNRWWLAHAHNDKKSKTVGRPTSMTWRMTLHFAMFAFTRV